MLSKKLTLLIAIAGVAVGFWVLVASNTFARPKEAETLLKVLGFSDVTLQVPSVWFVGCDRTTIAVVNYSAKTPSGQMATGMICQTWFASQFATIGS